MVSRLSCSWGRGKVVGPRDEGQVPEHSVRITEQEGRQSAMSSWKFSWGNWKDSEFQAGLNFNGWVMEAKSGHEAPTWIVGRGRKVMLKALKLLKVGPRKDSSPVWAFQEVFLRYFDNY